MPKKVKAVSWNHDKQIESKTTYGKWLNAHGRRSRESGQEGELQESRRANPDSVAEGGGYYALDEATKEIQERMRRLLALAKQILTDRQYLVFKFMAINEPPLTEREVAKALSISRGRVHQLWEAVRQKLQRAYEQRTA